MVKEVGVFIFIFCYLEGILEVVVCCLCMVEVEGMNKLMFVCVIVVSEEMVVYINIEKL